MPSAGTESVLSQQPAIRTARPEEEICLRRAALRVLSSSPSTSTSLSIKYQRSITSVTTSPLYRSNFQKPSLIGFQRRWASEEATTQSEPEADGATEASHGDNSIAASANTQNATEEASKASSSATEQVTQAAETAKDSVFGAAQSVGAAAGLASDTPSTPTQATGTAPESPSTDSIKTVYVGNLFFDVRGDDLKKEFSKAGNVVDAKVIMDSRGLSKGFGYVEFTTNAEAQSAINTYNLQNFEGRRLSVQYSLPRTSPTSPFSRPDRPLHEPTRTLFIGNMSFDMSDRDLNDLFRTIKNVIDVRVAIDRRTGQPRGFAHADFIDVKDAEKAMEELRGKMVCGRALRVDYSTTTGRAAMQTRGAGAEGPGQVGAQQEGLQLNDL